MDPIEKSEDQPLIILRWLTDLFQNSKSYKENLLYTILYLRMVQWIDKIPTWIVGH